MPHFLTECIPIDMSEAEFAPMYFQKAFQEAEGLWATNKAVINTMKEQSHYKKVPPQLGKYCSCFKAILLARKQYGLRENALDLKYN